MSRYYPTIGLEIHAELKTSTKMFCDSKNDTSEERPNVNVCPVCMGHPGTLPVVNKEAVKHILKIGTAVGGEIADFSEFDRKNYFYPDIPKGYQISQYKFPLVKGGELAGVKLTRVHLEEDTAKSYHIVGEGEHSLVDFNRAGVPLMELVTEPEIRSAEQAVKFAKELQLLLRTLGVATADMEKGEMRVEANISVSLEEGKYGTKVEVKNLNSFRSVERAIRHELERHEKLLDSGEAIVQETRGWEEKDETTFSQRRKEESHDYRYFPDPDIPKLKLSEVAEFSIENIKRELPELPWQKRERLAREYSLKSQEADFFLENESLGKLFESSVKDADANVKRLAANYIITDISAMAKADKDELKIRAEDYLELMNMINRAEISSRGAKDILKIMFTKGGNPKTIAQESGLLQTSDETQLKTAVKKVIDSNKKVFDEYKAGKIAALQFLIGQTMKETKGSGNPAMIRSIIESL